MSENTTAPHYLVNPDVVLREEDPDGELLFNPDTNQLCVLNHTGLFIQFPYDPSRVPSKLVTVL
jgi:hypothetical protein